MISKFVKISGSLLVFFWDRLSGVVSRIIGNQPSPGYVVLYYHRIPGGEKKKFERQMKCIVRWAQPVSVRGTEENPNSRIKVMVTFDDGFQSVVNNALPALLKYNIPSVFFIPSGYLGKKPSWDGVSSDEKEKEKVISASQLKKLPLDLMAIGSHSISHPRLPEIHDDAAKREIIKSKSQLENILGEPVHTFSFPYGAFNEKHLAWSSEAGYQRVFTSLPVVNYTDSEKFVWGRTSVEPSDWPIEFLLKVHGAYRWLPAAFALKAKFRSIYAKISWGDT